MKIILATLVLVLVFRIKCLQESQISSYYLQVAFIVLIITAFDFEYFQKHPYLELDLEHYNFKAEEHCN